VFGIAGAAYGYGAGVALGLDLLAVAHTSNIILALAAGHDVAAGIVVGTVAGVSVGITVGLVFAGGYLVGTGIYYLAEQVVY
jgi:hypothetical protein